MGQAIYYCCNCSKQLRDAHLEQGKAFRVGENVCCYDCAPESVRKGPRNARKASSPAIPTPRPMRASQVGLPAATKTSNPMPLLAAALGGAALVALVAFLLLSGRSTPPPEPAPPKKASTSPAPAPVTASAPKAPDAGPLEAPRRYAREHPDDIEGQIKRFEDVAFKFDGSAAGAEARKEIELLRAREREAVERDLLIVNREISDLIGAERFGQVFDILSNAKHRQRGSQWKLALGKRVREIEDRVKLIFDGLKAKAMEAKAAGRTSELDGHARRVRDWGLDLLAEDLKDALSRIEGPPPPDSPELALYRTAWEKATAKRDFAAAAAGLERLALKDADTLARRAKDVEELKALAKTYPELAPEIVKAAPRFLTIGGRSGRVMSIDAERIELLFDPKSPTSFFEWKELPLRALFALARRGDAPEIAGRLDERLPEPSPEERSARELFYQAERDWRDMSTRGKAIEAYAKLLSSPYAKRAKERAEGGREYYLVDLAYGGSALPTSDGHVAADGPGWIEAEFYARPSTTYRAWIYAWAKDAELRVEVTDGAPRKLALKGTKAAWTELPLPKFAGGGAKKIRLSGSQAGWGAGAVVVSATRTQAPGDAEAAELAKSGEGRSNAPVLVSLDDFETDPTTWGFVGGWEFPGAKGSLEIDASTAKAGKRSVRLTGDFTGGGYYVGTWRGWEPPKGWDVREIRLWVRTDAHADMGLRLADASEQCHQSRLQLKPGGEWQELVLRISERVGGEHWGGANDGRWHGPFKGFGLNSGRGTPKGTLWVDDVRVILEPAP